MPRPTRCTAQPPGTPDPTRPLLLQNTPKREQEARVPPKRPQNWVLPLARRCKELMFPVGCAHGASTAFTAVFTGWFGSNPALLLLFMSLIYFFFLLKCHIHGKRGKGALPEHSGDMQGKKTGRGENPRDGALPRLGSYSLMNLLVRNFTVRAAGWEGLGEDSTVTPQSSAPCAPVVPPLRHPPFPAKMYLFSPNPARLSQKSLVDNK